MLQFEEKSHTYTWNGEKLRSVTDLIYEFFPFNLQAIAQSKARKFNMPVEDMLKIITYEAEVASLWGSYVHKQAENYFHGLPTDANIALQLAQFFKDFDFLKKYQAEWRVCALPWKVAGTIDLLMEDAEGKLYIFDWKTSKEIYINSKYAGKPPLDHLDDSNYTTYSLQLNLYKSIIEHFYGKRVHYMGIVQINPHKRSYKLIQALDLQDDVYNLLSLHGVKKELLNSGSYTIETETS